jgi:hypothetical protein
MLTGGQIACIYCVDGVIDAYWWTIWQMEHLRYLKVDSNHWMITRSGRVPRWNIDVEGAICNYYMWNMIFWNHWVVTHLMVVFRSWIGGGKQNKSLFCRRHIFFLSSHTAIFKPTTFLEPVFQPAKISLCVWNRGDAIMHYMDTTTCNRFYWNKI